MHTLLWILFFAYAVFSLIWTIWQTKDAFPECHENVSHHWSYSCGFRIGRRFYIEPLRAIYCAPRVILFVLFVAVMFVVSPIYQLRRGYLYFVAEPRDKRKEEERKCKEAEDRLARDQRVKKWKEEHPPVLYYNTIHGITVVVTKRDYDSAAEEAARAKRDGRHKLGKQLPVIAASHLFCHASAKTVPDTHTMGWLSDFDDLKKVAKVERRKDIYVPFLAGSTIPVEEQLRLLQAVVDPSSLPKERVGKAHHYLLWNNVPDEVMYPKQ